MTRIDNLAAAFFGNKRLEDSSQGSGTLTRTEMGTATTNSQDGMVEVVMGDETIPSRSLDGTEGTNAVQVPTTVAVKEGDQVIVTLVGTDSVKTPTVTGVVGYGDRVEEVIESIDTSPHFFWHDDAGTHVATVEEGPSTGTNILANASGIFMRFASAVAAAITETALHVFGKLVLGNHNVEDTSNRYDVICGDGTSDTPHNAWMIKKDGHVVDSDGGSTLMAYELFSSNGTKATDGGTLTQSLSGFKYVTVFFHSDGTPYPNDGYDTYGSSTSIVTSGSTHSIDCSINKVSYNNQASPVYYTFHCQVGMSGTTWHANSSECGYSAIVGTTCKSGTGCRIYIDRIVGYK